MNKILLLGYTSPEDIGNLERRAVELKSKDFAHVAVVATPATRRVTGQSGKFDEVVSYRKGYAGSSRLSNITKLWGFLSQIRAAKFDQALVIYGSFHSRRYFKYELISLFSGAREHGYITQYGEKRLLPSKWAHLVHIWRNLALVYLAVKYLIVATALFFHVYFKLKDRLSPPEKKSSA